MGRTILSEYSATGAACHGQGEWEDWRPEELRDRRLTMGREHSETRPQAQGRAMRKEDVRWELERERRRMEDHDERQWKLDRMIDEVVDKAREELRLRNMTMIERLWMEQARHMTEMRLRKDMEEVGVIDGDEEEEVALTEVDEEQESEEDPVTVKRQRL